IRGGGLSWAEGKIKGEPDRYCIVDESSGTLGELQGLSCRWQPLASQKGSIVSLLIRSQNSDDHVIGEILEKLDHVIEGKVPSANPVSKGAMRYKTLGQTVKTEWKYVGKVFAKTTINRTISILVSIWAFAKRWPAPFDVQGYVDQIPSHSDYRKFDDMLRMVLDCSPKQVNEIRNYLEGLHGEGKIYFGLHESSHALMTCMVGNLSEGGHIHFIDGGDGGYAIAAKYLKEQMNASKEIKNL
ncbi:MAG: DUF3095 family protein, partial [Proteobacteria bacterium]